MSQQNRSQGAQPVEKAIAKRRDLPHTVLGSLRSSGVGMALNRVEGDEELYVGG